MHLIPQTPHLPMTTPHTSSKQASACGGLGVVVMAMAASRWGFAVSVVAGNPGHLGGAANIPFAPAF